MKNKSLTIKTIDGVTYVKLSEIQDFMDDLTETLKGAKEESELCPICTHNKGRAELDGLCEKCF